MLQDVWIVVLLRMHEIFVLGHLGVRSKLANWKCDLYISARRRAAHRKLKQIKNQKSGDTDELENEEDLINELGKCVCTVCNGCVQMYLFGNVYSYLISAMSRV